MKTAQLLNLLVVAALSIGLGVASIFAFPQTESAVQEGWGMDAALKWEETVALTEDVTAFLNERDRFTIFADGEATLTWDESTEHVDISLTKGSLYYSTLAGDFSVSIITPFARVDSQNSAAYVTYDTEAGQLDVYAVTHPSQVTFVLNEEDLNALLVPSDYRMKVLSSKVSATLARLRLTKLSKEFQNFAFETSELPENVLSAIEESEAEYELRSVDALNAFRKSSDFGPATTGFGAVLSNSYGFIRDILTVLPSAELRLEENQRDHALVYAYTNLLYGETTAGETWTDAWETYSHDVEEVNDFYRSLFFVLPGEELYPLKSAAADILYPDQDPLSALRRQFQEIESLLDNGFYVEAESAYLDYQENFEAALQAGDFDDTEDLDDISREYVLLELLLRSYSTFYSTDSVHLLTELEDKILALAGSDEDLDEERQAFVQSKIRFLDNLFDYVIERKVSVDDATDLAKELLSQAESYLNSITSEVAVMDYFESKLEEFDLSVAFMNSPEFYSYESFDEGLADYKAKEEDLEDLNEYLQSIRSGEEESATLSLEDAISEVEADLRSNGIQFADIISLGDSANRLFEIDGARTGGYSFEANYDRETKILYDVVVEDVRFSAGLTLENAEEVIVQAVEDSEATDEEESTETTSEEDEESSLTESVAISRVESDFEAAELNPSDFVITVVDLEENVFTVEGSVLQDQVIVSGTYDLDTGLLTEIVWEYGGESSSLVDVSLDELEAELQTSINQ